jgi:hypothetical protein
LEGIGRQLQHGRLAGWVGHDGVAAVAALLLLGGDAVLEEEEQPVEQRLDGSFPSGESQQYQSVGWPAAFVEYHQ